MKGNLLEAETEANVWGWVVHVGVGIINREEEQEGRSKPRQGRAIQVASARFFQNVPQGLICCPSELPRK
jgi:hypothetical protein